MKKYAITLSLILLATMAYAGPPAPPPLSVPSQAEAEAGTSAAKRSWTAERVKQAIDALAPGGSVTQEQIDDYIDALINDEDSVHTRITITYDDTDNAMDFVVDAETDPGVTTHETTYTHSNYDTAYGWGNHASAGYQPDLDVVPQAEAEAGSATTERIWTAQRVKNAIDALAPGGLDEVVYLSDCSGISNGFCIDTDDGKLYFYNNSAVDEVLLDESDPGVTTHESTYNHANYNTAYGWGDHSAAGYESETHASEHADGGADEIAVTAGMMNGGTGASSSTYWRGDNTWSTAGTGDFSGPASSTDNAFVRFNGTGGKTGQNAQTTEDDSGNVIIAGTATSTRFISSAADGNHFLDAANSANPTYSSPTPAEGHWAFNKTDNLWHGHNGTNWTSWWLIPNWAFEGNTESGITVTAQTDGTVDFTIENHASKHQDGGSDEVAVTAGMMNTGTGASSTTYWRGDNTWAAPEGSGTITAVGPAYSNGAAFTDGLASTGTVMFVWEGTGVDANELSIISPSADPGADIDITLPSATGTLLTTDGVGTSLTALNGENIQDDTIDEDSIDWGSGTDQIDADDIPGGSTNKWVTAANVGAISANLDDTDASIEWEDAADLESDGSLSPGSVLANEIGAIAEQKDFTILDPDDDDFHLFKAQRAITITDIHCIASGGGTITLTLYECTSTGETCTTEIENAITCAAEGNNSQDDGTLSDGAIAANNWVYANLGAASGTVNHLVFSIFYTEDK